MRRDDLRALAERAAHIHADMLALNKKTVEEQRSFTAEEEQEFTRMRAEFEDVNEQRRRGEELFAQDQSVQFSLNTPVEVRTGVENALPATFKDYQERRRRAPWAPDEPEVRSAYYRYLIEGHMNLDVEEQRALSRATGAAGNFLVPVDVADEIARHERWLGGIEDAVRTVMTESGETLNVPTNMTHGTATHTAENASNTPSDETFGQVALGANKVTTKIIVSEELIQDAAFDLVGFLAQEFGERIRVVKETAYITGSGTGQAQGLMLSGNGVPTYTAATGNATTYSYAALVTGIFTLPAQYRRNASFVIGDASARNLYLMVDGQQRPLWNINVATGGPDTFLGYPIYTHPDVAAPAANARSMFFGDLRRTYWARLVRGYSVQRQDELHSDNGQIGFRAQQRYDGKVVNPNAGLIFINSAT